MKSEALGATFDYTAIVDLDQALKESSKGMGEAYYAGAKEMRDRAEPIIRKLCERIAKLMAEHH